MNNQWNPKAGDRVNYNFNFTKGMVKGIDGKILSIEKNFLKGVIAIVEIKKPWGLETQKINVKDLILQGGI